jgi:hypothetical protein
VRYRPPRAKYESVSGYLRLVGWRSDFDPVTRRALMKTQRIGFPQYSRPGAKPPNSSPAKLLYEVGILGDFRVSG